MFALLFGLPAALLVAALSISNYAENKLLETLKGTAFSVSTVYVSLHTADPGETGATGEISGGSYVRKAVTFAAAASGTMNSNADVSWTGWDTGTQTVTHVALWDASSAGNCLWSGALTASKTVQNGDTFTIASGSLSLTLD